MKISERCEALLKDWCEGLYRLQMREPENPACNGAIWCPACGRIHGRCFDAMYPFLCRAKLEADGQARKKWVEAAEQLFDWAEQNVSELSGAFINDTDEDWRGTTVFSAIQLSNCLKFHANLLTESTAQRWRKRLAAAADFLCDCEVIRDNNINYPISNALALYVCGDVLDVDAYRKKAAEWARVAETHFTQNGLLFGEGAPRSRVSPRGCRPVDIGYNVEESLPALALYARLSGDARCEALARRGLRAQLAFQLPDGGWDNSMGTRNYKWSYWGSRTSDGCALGYLLYAEEEPDFEEAAARNLELLAACTFDGLLAGGPHYADAGQKACVHHSFTHAKVAAEILDRRLGTCEAYAVKPEKTTQLRGCSLNLQKKFYTLTTSQTEPCTGSEEGKPLRFYPELASWRFACGGFSGTVTAYDWEYLPGGHVSGGTLSMLYHSRAGALFVVSMGKYTRLEPPNMQLPRQVLHECTALRIEAEIDGRIYSSIYEYDAQVHAQAGCIETRGVLRDIAHNPIPAEAGKDGAYCLRYAFSADGVTISAAFHTGSLICPLVSRAGEAVELRQKSVRIEKQGCSVELEASAQPQLPYGECRIFHLCPGVQALRMDFPAQEEVLVLKLKVEDKASAEIKGEKYGEPFGYLRTDTRLSRNRRRFAINFP